MDRIPAFVDKYSPEGRLHGTLAANAICFRMVPGYFKVLE